MLKVLSGLMLACVVRGTTPPITPEAEWWIALTPRQQAKTIWRLRDRPDAVAVAPAVLERFRLAAPADSASLEQTARWFWWQAEGEQDAARRSKLLDEAERWSDALLSRFPTLPSANLTRALVLTVRANGEWSLERQQRFLELIDRAKSEPLEEERLAALGRFELETRSRAPALRAIGSRAHVSRAPLSPRLRGALAALALLEDSEATTAEARSHASERLMILSRSRLSTCEHDPDESRIEALDRRLLGDVWGAVEKRIERY